MPTAETERCPSCVVTIVLPVAAVVIATLLAGGCSNRPTLLPNRDKGLRKTSTQFAADAAKRHPYKADADRGGEAVARAQIGYALDQLDVVNLSNEDWKDVEIWVNQQYVVAVPAMRKSDLKTLSFRMLYDANGKSFPTDNNKPAGRINKVEVYRDGKMYDVPVRLGD
jgi:hypothetical protein